MENNKRLIFVLGVIAIVSLLLPYLGQEFKKIFIIHPRVLSLFLIAMSFFLYLHLSSLNKTHEVIREVRVIDILVLLLFATMIEYYHPEQGLFKFESSYNNVKEYPNYKMGRIFVNVR